MDSNFQQELRIQIQILEAMFGDPGLRNLRRTHPNHPAVHRHDVLAHHLAKPGGVQFSKEVEVLRELAAMMFDRSTWATNPPSGDYWAFVTDPGQRARIRQLIRDPDQFGDVMAEVFFWGLLISEGIPTRWVDQPGLPDLALAPSAAADVWADVKHIRLGSSVDRIQDHISKANKQIKRAGQTSGLVFIRIERSPERGALDDRVPSDIRSYVQRAEALLRGGMCTSVSQVVVCWDDYLVVGEMPEPLFWVLRRRSIVLDHPKPRTPATISSSRLEMGRTLTTWIRSAPSSSEDRPPLAPIISGDIEVSQLFRDLNEFGEGLRPGHAIEVLKDPDSRFVFEIDQFQLILCTRKVTLGRKPYVILIVAAGGRAERTQIQLGFKIFDFIDAGAGEVLNPRVLFARLLERYGLPIRVGEYAGLFVERATVNLPGSIIQGPDSGDFFVSAMIKINSDNTADAAWCFAIDRERYRGAVLARAS